jgi:hypothetical protein
VYVGYKSSYTNNGTINIAGGTGGNTGAAGSVIPEIIS